MATRLNAEAVRAALEEHNLDALLGFYADEVEMTIVDQDHPPSRPRILSGKEEVRGYLADVFARQMSHRSDALLIDDDAIAYRLVCEYGNGNRVLASSLGELRDGKIVRETLVQAWDCE